MQTLIQCSALPVEQSGQQGAGYIGLFKQVLLNSGSKNCEDHSPLFQSTVLINNIIMPMR